MQSAPGMHLEQLRSTDSSGDPNLPGTIAVAVTLKPVRCGTELRIEQSGVPAPLLRSAPFP